MVDYIDLTIIIIIIIIWCWMVAKWLLFVVCVYFAQMNAKGQFENSIICSSSSRSIMWIDDVLCFWVFFCSVFLHYVYSIIRIFNTSWNVFYVMMMVVSICVSVCVCWSYIYSGHHHWLTFFRAFFLGFRLVFWRFKGGGGCVNGNTDAQ